MILLSFLFAMCQSTTPAPPCQARLELRQQDGFLTITGHCRNLLLTANRYRYELSLQREGSGGSSRNTQRGEVNVAPQQEVSLSQTRVNNGPMDSYQIHLRVLDLNGHVVAQDSAYQAPAH